MSNFGITLGYEIGICSICKKKKEIRIIYDKGSHKIVKVCDDCVAKHSSESVKQLIKKYGKKTTKKNIEILSKERFLRV
ncbi:MAG: hypothetical protein J7K22_00675 [Nanoarchaeota archaeon]|nr:hypothetical protein [Nanoarchaeota archaeon]